LIPAISILLENTCLYFTISIEHCCEGEEGEEHTVKQHGDETEEGFGRYKR